MCDIMEKEKKKIRNCQNMYFFIVKITLPVIFYGSIKKLRVDLMPFVIGLTSQTQKGSSMFIVVGKALRLLRTLL